MVFLLPHFFLLLLLPIGDFLLVAGEPLEAVPGVETLRAIPWIFAWYSLFCIAGSSKMTFFIYFLSAGPKCVCTCLFGWGKSSCVVVPGEVSNETALLSVGAALRQEIDKGHLETLQLMCKDWPWFKTTLSHVEMVLGKADVGIASVYEDALVPTKLRPIGDMLRDELKTVGDWLFVQRIVLCPWLNEWLQTGDSIMEIFKTKKILQNNAQLSQLLQLRHVLVDPLNLIQAVFLKRLRGAANVDQAMVDILSLTIQGIAAGMQNTG